MVTVRAVVVIAVAGAAAMASCREDGATGGTANGGAGSSSGAKASSAGKSPGADGDAGASGDGGSAGRGDAGGKDGGSGEGGSGDVTGSGGETAAAGSGGGGVGGNEAGGNGTGEAGGSGTGEVGLAGAAGAPSSPLCLPPTDISPTGTAIPLPALYYRFEDADVTSNVLQDLSGNGLNATIEAGITTGVDGIAGHAFEFDGATGSMTLSSVSSLKVSPTTVSAWINVPPNRADRGVFVNLGNGSAAWTGWALEARLTDEVMWVTQGGTSAQQILAVGCVEPNRWMHFVGVFDGSATTLYRDGVYLETKPVDYTTIPYGTLPLVFGHHSLFLNRYFEGKLDEFAIWTRDLTPSEVYAVYVAGLNGQSIVP